MFRIKPSPPKTDEEKEEENCEGNENENDIGDCLQPIQVTEQELMMLQQEPQEQQQQHIKQLQQQQQANRQAQQQLKQQQQLQLQQQQHQQLQLQQQQQQQQQKSNKQPVRELSQSDSLKKAFSEPEIRIDGVEDKKFEENMDPQLQGYKRMTVAGKNFN